MAKKGRGSGLTAQGGLFAARLTESAVARHNTNGDPPQRGQTRAAPTGAASVVPAKKLRKKDVQCVICSKVANPDGSNWGATKSLEDARTLPDGVACLECADFVSGHHLSTEELTALRQTGGKSWEALEKQRLEHAENFTTPNARAFEGETVYWKVKSGSTLSERFGFLSRAEFKEAYNVFPEAAKITQIKATTCRGEECPGVLVKLPGSRQELTVFSTKEWTRYVPHLRGERHLWQQQAAEVWEHQVQGFQRNMGQSLGGKYAAKHKVTRAYDETEINDLVNAVPGLTERRTEGASSTGLAARVPGGEEEDDSMEEDEEEDEDEADDGHQSGEEAQQRIARSPQPVFFSAAKPVSHEAARFAWQGTVGHTTPQKSKQKDSSKSPVANLRRSGSAISLCKFDTGSVVSSAVADEEDGGQRTKSASYWHATLLLANAWNKNLSPNRLRFARLCVERSGIGGQAWRHRPQTMRG
jgi:hypothetical protein